MVVLGADVPRTVATIRRVIASLHTLALGHAPTFAARLTGSQARILLRLVRHFILFRLLFHGLGTTGGWIAIIAVMAAVYLFSTMHRGRLRR
ncbi:MAG: hypothetical protein QOI61_2382 [Actinomycetota bacterium]